MSKCIKHRKKETNGRKTPKVCVYPGDDVSKKKIVRKVYKELEGRDKDEEEIWRTPVQLKFKPR